MYRPNLGEYSGTQQNTLPVSTGQPNFECASIGLHGHLCKICGRSFPKGIDDHTSLCSLYWAMNRYQSYSTNTKLNKYNDATNRLYLKDYLISFFGVLDRRVLKQHVKQCIAMLQSDFWNTFLTPYDNVSNPNEASCSQTTNLTQGLVKSASLRTEEIQEVENCEFCSKSVANSCELLACYKEHAAVEKSRFYICEECQEIFSSERLYIQHMQKFRKELQDSSSNSLRHKNYSCEICGLMFVEERDKYKHLKELCQEYSTWSEEDPPKTKRGNMEASPSDTFNKEENPSSDYDPKMLSYFKNFLSIYYEIIKKYKERKRIPSDSTPQLNAELNITESQVFMRESLNQPLSKHDGPSATRSTQGTSKKGPIQKVTAKKRSAVVKRNKSVKRRIGISEEGKFTLSIATGRPDTKTCEFCSSEPSDLTQCYVQHFTSSRKWWICEVCDELFHLMEAFKTHMRQQHSEY